MQDDRNSGKTIFISAFNVKSFGSVRILYDLVNQLHKLNFFDQITINCSDEIEAQNLPNDVKILRSGIWDSNFFLKILWQYIGLWLYSLRNHYNYMLSINNLTPNFRSDYSLLYLHNALPFARYAHPSYGKWLKVICQQLYFSILLPIGLKRNSAVIVQQLTLKKLFLSRYPFMEGRVAIIPPSIPEIITKKKCPPHLELDYLYLPVNELCYKNAGTLLLAFNELSYKYPNLHLIVTLRENCSLVRRLKKKKKLETRNIQFVGLQEWEKNIVFLENAKALLWGSSVESWGMPLSEAVSLNVDIIAPHLSYVEETLGQYNRVYLFEDISQKSVVKAIEAWKLKKNSVPKRRPQIRASQLSDIFNSNNAVR